MQNASRLNAAALGFFMATCAASAANAQGYYGPPASGPTEQLEVIAPRVYRQPNEEWRPLNAPPAEMSLSTVVHFEDLDLRSRAGARELRHRIFAAARNVCGQLDDAYPVYPLTGTHCFRTAYENGIVRAKSAITAARVAWRQSYW